jgi:hypothetical protein
MIIGIVGHEAKKFTSETEAKAKEIIQELIARPDVTGVTSGECHLGGIDIWAHEETDRQGKMFYPFPPLSRSWETGYKPRNINIAETGEECHCIVIKEYDPSFGGMKFDYCYHCKTKDHIKSGGCWTAHYAIKLGKKGFWHVV